MLYFYNMLRRVAIGGLLDLKLVPCIYPCFGIVYAVELLGSSPIILHNQESETRSVNWGFERY